MRRSKFSLSHYRLQSMDMGELVPLTWFEALPGDTIQMATNALIRVAPLLAPVMHPCMVRIHHWFVPNRLIWEDWEDFITGGPDGTFEAAPPNIQLATVETGSLGDYLGIPPSTGAGAYNALPFRAYSLIFNDHYRDQDLVSELPVGTASGEDTTTNVDLQNCAWEKDYFTTARPWEQKGEEVSIPIDITPADPPRNIQMDTDGSPGYLSTNASADVILNTPLNAGALRWVDPALDGSSINVNELREALAQQRYMEARAMYGSRYVEYLRYLGVRSSDARLQNPEYLGGGRQVIQFSEVLATAEGTETNVGDLKGHGIAAMRSNRYRRFFEEHGIVMTLMSVVPKSIYMQALPRQWHRLNKEMYFQKELQYLGDQSIINAEVQHGHQAPNTTFGYAPRYDEYRSLQSSVGGEFNNVLNYWHLARDLQGNAALNSGFVTCVPTKRVYASTDTDCLYVMANHSIQARRLLKKDPQPRTF